jgi:hypothetical protein
MMGELAQGAKTRQPGTHYRRYDDDGKTVVRVRLEVLPDSLSPEELHGCLKVQVRQAVCFSLPCAVHHAIVKSERKDSQAEHSIKVRPLPSQRHSLLHLSP